MLFRSELNIQGTLAIKLIKHKTLELFDKNGLPHSLQPFVVPAPTSEDVTAIKQWLQYAEKEINQGSQGSIIVLHRMVCVSIYAPVCVTEISRRKDETTNKRRC